MANRRRDQTPFWDAIARGETIAEASRQAGVSSSTGQKWRRAQHHGDSSGSGTTWAERSSLDKDPRPHRAELPPPVPPSDLNAAAGHAIDDFNFFAERYFGRVSTPWRLETAERVLELYNSPEKQFVVINAPPGVGKSALFTHDIPAWLTCRNRAIRGVLGSWGINPATTFTRTLRRTLERVAPAPFSDEEVERHLAVEPTGVLATDFGRFKPLDAGEYWTATAFVCEQLDGRPVADKEPTWTAFGQGEILGWRVDLMIWDDLVTTRKLASEAEQDRMRLWWNNEVEKRLEPGGLLVLQGQRLGSNDLYRYCLDKLDVEYSDDNIIDAVDPDDPTTPAPRKYHHVKFPAHSTDRCHPDNPDHGLSAAPYPAGCLLDPRRLTHRDLAREEFNDPIYFATVYQQEDTAQDQVLVPRVWIEGADDYPGCWDRDRGGWEIPELEGRFITVISCDPSPAKMWAIQAWALHPDSDQYFLLDAFRGQMTAERLLYYLHSDAGVISTNAYSGQLEEWREMFARMGHPLRHVVVEKNVAQRFLLQYPHTRTWERKYGITIHDHETDAYNKADKDYGIQMLRPLFRHGKIRLPGLQAAVADGRIVARHNAAKLVSEITRYSLQFGASGTDDQVLAAWFMAHKARKLKRMDIDDMPLLYQDLPSWMNDESLVMM